MRQLWNSFTGMLRNIQIELQWFGHITRIPLGWGIAIWLGITILTWGTASITVMLFSRALWESHGWLPTVIGPESIIFRFVIALAALLWAHYTRLFFEAVKALSKTWEAIGEEGADWLPFVKYPEGLKSFLSSIHGNLDTILRTGKFWFGFLVALPIWPMVLFLPAWSLADWNNTDSKSAGPEGEDRPWVRRGLVHVLILFCVFNFLWYVNVPVVSAVPNAAYDLALSAQERIATTMAGWSQENISSAEVVYRIVSDDTALFRRSGTQLVTEQPVARGVKVKLYDARDRPFPPVEGSELMIRVVLPSEQTGTYAPGTSPTGFVPWDKTVPESEYRDPQPREEPNPPLAIAEASSPVVQAQPVSNPTPAYSGPVAVFRIINGQWEEAASIYYRPKGEEEFHFLRQISPNSRVEPGGYGEMEPIPADAEMQIRDQSGQRVLRTFREPVQEVLIYEGGRVKIQ